MRVLLAMAFLATTGFGAPAIAATSINPTWTTPTSLGSFSAGSYRITTTGLIDLLGAPGSGFTMRPDGVPDIAVTDVRYLYFNPGGTDYADGRHGQAGPGFNIGSLVGSFVANPGIGDFFAIGFGTVVTLAAPGSLYAVVNDTYHVNNGGSFQVEVAPVPEPAAWALLIAGFGLTGAAMRRRQGLGATR